MLKRPRRSAYGRHKDAKLDERRRKTHVFRVNFVSSIVFLAMSSLIFRLGYLQITKGAYLKAQAETTSVQYIPVLPARGRIYDTHGNLLAYDKPTYSLYFTRVQNVNDSVSMIQKIAALLAPVFHTSQANVVKLMQANQKYSTVTLFKHLTKQQLTFVSEHQSKLPGVNVEVDGQRTYAEGDLAGQVLGYVGQITPKNKDYYLKHHYLEIQHVGVAGLELQYENLLKGKVGYQEQQYNTVNYGMKPVGYIAPVSGDNLQLTLDGRLQADTQNIVMNAIQNFENKNHVKITDAAAVAMNVKTGGILAMVSYPYLDPNWFVPGNDYLKHAKYLSTSGAEMNNVIQNPHYPGSTVKPANLITGLENGVITPNTVFDDNGTLQYIGTYPMREDASYGLVNDVEAIAVSDDRFFYTLGLKLGHWLGSSPTSGGYPQGGNLQKWRDTDLIKGLMTLARGEMRWGLGQLTGIDLPGEQAGEFQMQKNGQPVRMTAKDIHKITDILKSKGSYTNYGSPYDLAAMAFGQGQQFTPIELLQYVSTIANNGKKLKPHLLQAVYPPGLKQNLLASGAKPVKTIGATVQATLKLNPTYLKLAQKGMYGAVHNPLGTAYYGFLGAHYAAAGKTGTAGIYFNGRKTNNSVFIGYAPYNDPQIAVAIMVPGAGYGAQTAVPIARKMMDDYFDEEHASFMPKSQWTNTSIPSTWKSSAAYTVPETAK